MNAQFYVLAALTPATNKKRGGAQIQRSSNAVYL